MTEPQPVWQGKRTYMLASRVGGGTLHIVGWIPPVLRSRRLSLLTLCNRELVMAEYQETTRLVGVCTQCSALAQRDAISERRT
jgi:hypothetical protein